MGYDPALQNKQGKEMAYWALGEIPANWVGKAQVIAVATVQSAIYRSNAGTQGEHD